jgi:hypothetical protein
MMTGAYITHVSHQTVGNIHTHISKLGMDVSPGSMTAMKVLFHFCSKFK